ncbi:MAG: Carboxypeptidase regulatory-like protein [Xanthobacteraceae bacterium]|nr:Carboxypeptidase regulatory-like protein [Xanthobacteraceae bacterium]
MNISPGIRLITNVAAGLVAAPLAALILAAPAQSQGYAEGPVAGGGSIAGKVTFPGTVPTRKIIPTKDVEVCGAPRDEPLVIVGPDKGAQNVVIYLTQVAKGKPWPAAAKVPEIDNVKCDFTPSVQVIRPGKIDVVNNDPVLHNTHGYYDKRTAFNLALPNKGQRIPVDLTRAGTVRVDCDAHGWMEGWIYVVDNPYYALTSADGKFNIADVPPGNYTLVVAHPFTGLKQQPVTVAAGKPTDLAIELKK